MFSVCSTYVFINSDGKCKISEFRYEYSILCYFVSSIPDSYDLGLVYSAEYVPNSKGYKAKMAKYIHAFCIG